MRDERGAFFALPEGARETAQEEEEESTSGCTGISRAHDTVVEGEMVRCLESMTP